MDKKTMWMVGGGVAVVGLGYYFWSKSQPAATPAKQLAEG